MPEFQQPTLNIRTSYAGVGPLEMEELITRPIEQAVGAVPGLTRIESSSSEGNSQVQLNFEWGSDLAEVADEVRTRMDRIRGRLPGGRDPPTIQKFDPSQLPVAQIGIEGDYDPVTLRESRRTKSRPASSASTASPASTSTAACGGRFTSTSRRIRSPR
jgi:HAE1 family hydrophobic/amphiphilic exporter-1